MFDFGKKCFFDLVCDREWDLEIELEERCCDIVKVLDYESISFIIDFFYIDFDGFWMGLRLKCFVILCYVGVCFVKILLLYLFFFYFNDL